MSHRKLASLSIASALAIAGGLVSSLHLPGVAQSGLTIFSGVESGYELGYTMDFFGRPGARDRYRLNIPRDKMEVAASELFISYPDTYQGRFDADSIRLEVNGNAVDLDEVVWDQDNRVISIFPSEPIPANTRVQIVLSNVRNPNRVGTHYFNASIISPGDIPLRRYVGTWILAIRRN
ncbi:DUF2808 domain-containing protein [Egbenema bharatensis]|uniref:DUF2808 domain-containing protein n=1 Tax=Egbenema bharatensis TaxID=3463334 RepID=UPI003A8A6121